MFIRRALLLVLAIVWLWPSVLHAQSKALIEAYRQGKAFNDAGQYEQAIVFWRKAVELSEKEFGPKHPDTAGLLNNLAELYRAQGRYEAAEPLYKRSLAIREKALGPDHPDVATSLENVAALYRATNRNQAAEKLEQRAARIRAIQR